MKKTALLVLISFMNVFLLEAQNLFSDDKGVIVFCKIEKTNKTTFCAGNTDSGKKINIWKVTLGIENGASATIVPRGVGIADISVYPDPIKPYSHEYCNYEYVKNYEPNSTQRHLDQSLYVWPILDHKIVEILSGESITNTTYLYLYEGQQPKLTNWEFLGYRLKDDFDVNGDPILTDIKADNNTVTSKVTVVRNDKLKEESAITIAPKNLDSIKAVSADKATINSIATKELTIDEEIKPIEVFIEEKVNESEPLKMTNNGKVNKQIAVQETSITEENSNNLVKASDAIDVKEITPKVESKSEIIKINECPGEKSLEYREKSDASSDSEEQKAYSWLALYYSYVCECESGSQDNDQLVAVINNVVDSFMYNTKGKYGKITKVTKCTAPTTN